ncbi:hypothetical protein F5Y16DRAFT_376712 [Xylariaceae sp. FL0255]|nr:hypothetical protein F5Y16DRAFT_376712 [Xylariaceae sp. FL0255]
MLSSVHMGQKQAKIPKRNEDRVILHFDYDCFYASVFEHENPSLKSLPLGIKQKSILATCNYVARARGVKKLMLISEAQKICPDLVLMNGEDLTRFRDTSKKLWAFLRAHSWNDRVERLGLDEVFLDVSDVIAYNQETLNIHALGDSFFQLDRNDPVKGFSFDGLRFEGCVKGSRSSGDESKEIDQSNPLCIRLMLASHLAGYLRHKIDEDFGYTSSTGISTNKTLAKLAGTINKPNNQTTLLSFQDGTVESFLSAHKMRKIPGIGGRTSKLIEEHILSTPALIRDREGSVTVAEVLAHPNMSPELLEQILDRPGAERGSGEKIWNLLHGVDASEVKAANDVPTQISIEDTYMSQPLQAPAEVTRELKMLAASLVRRMRVDLTSITVNNIGPDPKASNGTQPSNDAVRWLAYPKTLRLSTCVKPRSSGYSSSMTATNTETPTIRRSSRSTALPNFIFNNPSSLDEIPKIAERLVHESLLPLFRRLHPERQGYNLSLLNICVTNMVIVASGDDTNGHSGGGSKGSARDISRMFRTQEEKLKEWTVYDTSSVPSPSSTLSAFRYQTKSSEVDMILDDDDEDEHHENNDISAKNATTPKTTSFPTPFSPQIPTIPNEELDNSSAWDEGEEDEGYTRDEQNGDPHRCPICGHAIPSFAMPAHERFHAMED